MIFKKNQLASSISAACLSGAFALGSYAAQAAEAETAAAGDDAAIVKVVITAQNRSQKLQDVPISLLVINNDQITKLGATNLADLNGYIPGLVVDAGQATQPSYTIRGIGTGDFGIGTDSPVGIYVDGVYTGKTGGALMNFNDVERVEVLKGPQGTLFGRNSAAGAISVVTKEPTFEAENDFNVRLGQYRERNLESMLNIPFSDTLALRFTFVDQRSDGWLKDSLTGKSLNATGDWGSRASLRWNAPEHTKVILSWEHESLNQQARPEIGLIPAALQTPAPAFPADPNTYLNPFHAPAYNNEGDNVEKRLYNGVTLRIEHPLDGATFNSTTAYRHFNSRNITNNSGTNQINSYLDTGNLEGNSTWQQEFKLSGKNDLVDWLTGVSFFSETATQSSQVITNTDTLDNIINNTSGIPLYSALNSVAQGMAIPVNLLGNSWVESMNNTASAKSYAVYGDAIWHVTSRLNLTTGVRFSYDSKDLSWSSPARSAPGVDAGIATINASQPTFFSSTGPLGGLGPLALQGLTTNIEYPYSPYKMTNSWTDVSPRAVLDYKVAPDVMVFGSVAKGYQSGGFNAQKPASVYAPETIWNYEAGIKSYFPEQHVMINASLFMYKFSNLQSLSLIGNSTSAIPQYQVASSDQSAKGMDMDVRWQASRNLRLFTDGEYIDQKYGSYTAHDANGPIVLDGKPVGTPLWTLAAGIDYTQRDVLNGKINYSLQHAYTGPVRCNADSIEQGSCLRTPAFTLGGSTQHTDGRIGWDNADRSWGLAVVVRNMLNNRNIKGIDTTSLTVLGTASAQISEPRSVGVQAHASF